MIHRPYLAREDLAAWNERSAHLAVAAGTAEIGSALSALLSIILEFDAIFLATFRRNAPPTVAYFVGTREPGAHYQDGPYLLDPFYAHFLNGGSGGCYRLSDLAPEGFLRSEYFSTYYGGLNIGDELGLLVAMDPQSCAHVSIVRRPGATRFTKSDCKWLNAAGPLVPETMRRINTTLAPTTRHQSVVHDSLQHAFQNFGTSVLTLREHEVTQLLLRGHSAKAIARSLLIATETARNHLKRIYSKLGVTSQAELFALFFRALAQVEPGLAGDPLALLTHTPSIQENARL
jgi:DNA-binding CsgD family transcriptional regulator